MATSSIRRARRARSCGSYPCERTIVAGEPYRRHVAFPGDEGHEEGTRPWVIDECRECAARYDRPLPPWEDREEYRADLIDPAGPAVP